MKELDSFLRDYLKKLGIERFDLSVSQINQLLKQSGFDISPQAIAQFNEYIRQVSALQSPRRLGAIPPASSSRENQMPAKKPARWKASIGTHAAARRMEAYIESKGMDLKEFAKRAGTTDRTLRKFRKTGLVRRDIFDEIAKAMGLTRDELLKS